nr:nucleotidyltransferase substrate binding protein [Kingella kingae]
MSFQDIIRTAKEQNLLLGNWADWKQYRDMRARTSHTYDEETAIAVV